MKAINAADLYHVIFYSSAFIGAIITLVCERLMIEKTIAAVAAIASLYFVHKIIEDVKKAKR